MKKLKTLHWIILSILIPYSTSRVPPFRELEGSTISPEGNPKKMSQKDGAIVNKELGILKKSYGPFGIFDVNITPRGFRGRKFITKLEYTNDHKTRHLLKHEAVVLEKLTMNLTYETNAKIPAFEAGIITYYHYVPNLMIHLVKEMKTYFGFGGLFVLEPEHYLNEKMIQTQLDNRINPKMIKFDFKHLIYALVCCVEENLVAGIVSGQLNPFSMGYRRDSRSTEKAVGSYFVFHTDMSLAIDLNAKDPVKYYLKLDNERTEKLFPVYLFHKQSGTMALSALKGEDQSIKTEMIALIYTVLELVAESPLYTRHVQSLYESDEPTFEELLIATFEMYRTRYTIVPDEESFDFSKLIDHYKTFWRQNWDAADMDNIFLRLMGLIYYDDYIQAFEYCKTLLRSPAGSCTRQMKRPESRKIVEKALEPLRSGEEDETLVWTSRISI